MTEEKFWKVVYLYATKYNYEIINYRPEKNDIWLIDKYNELIRFVYNEKITLSDIDSSTYNIIKNEQILRKNFKLSSLKIKVFYISNVADDNIQDYKKYKVSDNLIIERLLITNNNINKIVKADDGKFLNIPSLENKYREKVVNIVKKSKNKDIINYKFNFIAIFFVLLFSINYIILNYLSKDIRLYNLLDYNYNKVINGDFYRLFTSSLIFDNAINLVIISIGIFLCSIFLGDEIKISDFFSIFIPITFIVNLLIITGYFLDYNIGSLAFFGFLGSIFINELNRRDNNLKFIYISIFSFSYIILANMLFNINFTHYMFIFILGIFIKIIFMKKLNMIFMYSFCSLILVLGFITILLNINFSEKINNYHLKKAEYRLANNISDINKLEDEIKSKRRSVITYYELGMLKIEKSSLAEGEKVFLEALSFEDKFSPIFYQLAIISRSNLEIDKAIYYIDKAIQLDKDNVEYKDLQNELISIKKGN